MSAKVFLRRKKPSPGRNNLPLIRANLPQWRGIGVF
jgi:hypothetical protein